MTSLQLEEVDSVGRPRPPGQRTSVWTRELPLSDIRELVGAIPIPRYVPPGFSLAKSVVIAERDVYCRFQKDAELRNAIPDPILTLSLVRRAALKVKRGYVELIKVDNQDGILVKGQWIKRHRDAPFEWAPDGCTCLALERDGWVVIISGLEPANGAKYWDRDILMKIAESLSLDAS